MVIQGALSFWTTESLEVMNLLTYGGVQAAQFPLGIYEKWFQNFLIFVVPIACVAYFPVLSILGRPIRWEHRAGCFRSHRWPALCFSACRSSHGVRASPSTRRRAVSGGGRARRRGRRAGCGMRDAGCGMTKTITAHRTQLGVPFPPPVARRPSPVA